LVDASGRLRGFREKSADSSAALVSTGTYLLHRSLFRVEGSRLRSSLEAEWIPWWLSGGKQIAVIESDGPFIDIGTPESLAEAACFVRECGLFPAMEPAGP
jgi:D-glycero-alpha-D-manno-heptose 1-phosphate guanylyltransferase